MSVGALILAAGASTRFGSPKQLVRIQGETLIERSIRIVAEAGCAPAVVVLGAFEDLIRDQCDLSKVVAISNPLWSDGMGTSLSAGAIYFRDATGVIVMTCDMPAVNADHLRALSASHSLTASFYGGHKGVPAYFPQSFLPALAGCNGDSGARQLLKDAHAIDLPNGDLDVDTQGDLERALSLYS